jgi:hypothetical protein
VATIGEHLMEIEGVVDQMVIDGHTTEDVRIMAGINEISYGVMATRNAVETVEKENQGIN